MDKKTLVLKSFSLSVEAADSHLLMLVIKNEPDKIEEISKQQLKMVFLPDFSV